MNPFTRPYALLITLIIIAWPGRVLAAPRTTSPSADRIADSDLDREDVALLPALPARTESHPFRSQALLSLQGWTGPSPWGTDYGMLITVSLPWNRIGMQTTGPQRSMYPSLANVAYERPTSSPSHEHSPRNGPRSPRIVVTPELAQQTVRQAILAARLPLDDGPLDDTLRRARASAWLPELRLRLLRGADERATQELAAVDTRSSGAASSNWYFEARATWRLDRALYADDEPTLGRLRLDVHDSRAKVASRALGALFEWQRATVEIDTLEVGSREHILAEVRVAEQFVLLNELTGGWFARSWNGQKKSEGTKNANLAYLQLDRGPDAHSATRPPRHVARIDQRAHPQAQCPRGGAAPPSCRDRSAPRGAQ